MVSAQTADQKKFLRNYKSDKALYVEGPFFIWVRRLQRYFFTLRADAELDNESGEGEIGTLGSKIGPGNDVVFQATFFLWLKVVASLCDHKSYCPYCFSLHFYLPYSTAKITWLVHL